MSTCQSIVCSYVTQGSKGDFADVVKSLEMGSLINEWSWLDVKQGSLKREMHKAIQNKLTPASGLAWLPLKIQEGGGEGGHELRKLSRYGLWES